MHCPWTNGVLPVDKCAHCAVERAEPICHDVSSVICKGLNAAMLVSTIKMRISNLPRALGLAMLVMALPLQVLAAEVDAFLGSYVGQAVSESGGEISARDIAVEIRGRDKGFTLKWSTVTKRKDGRLKRKAYEVNFVRSKKDNVYASAMRKNLFGKAVPMDPLKGDPFVWATIDGATLTVHALIITEDHGYEMQTYARTRTDKGLDLMFHRVRDGERLRDVNGTLVKVD